MTTRSPFTPPIARMADPSNVIPGSLAKAVFVGLAVDIGGTILTAVLVGVAYGIHLVTVGGANQGTATAARMSDPASPFFIAAVLLGCASSVLGGYVCARIAKRAEYRLAVVMAIIWTAMGLLLTDDRRHSLLLMLALAVATFGALLIGAKLGHDRNRKP